MIQIILAPLLLAGTGIFSFLAPLTNLLVLFMMPFLLGFAFIGAIMEMAGFGFGTYLLQIAGFVTDYILSSSSLITSVPFSFIQTETLWQPWQVAAFYTVLASGSWLIIQPGFSNTEPLKKVLVGISIPIFVLIAITLIPFEKQQTRVVFLNVDQGDSILIEHGDIRFLVDTGRSGPRLIRELNELGIEEIQFLILTHADNDHIGGTEAFLQHYQPIQIIINNEETFTEISQLIISPDTDILFQAIGNPMTLRQPASLFDLMLSNENQNLKLEFLHPLNIYGAKNRNNSSSVLLVSLGTTDVLLTGDIQTEAESEILNRYGASLEGVEIVKASHHGASSSNSKVFVDTLKPKHAIMSCGIHNQYRHPDGEVLLRYDSVGAEILRTDWNGRIQFLLQPDSYSVKMQRTINRSF